MLALASLFPGLDLLIPRTPVTLTAVVGALVTVAVVALLQYLASGLAALTRLALDGPAEIVEHVASVSTGQSSSRLSSRPRGWHRP